MSKIKELFGVEIGEKFDIKDKTSSSDDYWVGCYFDEKGQLQIPGLYHRVVEQSVMCALLIGKAEIIKHEKAILDEEEKRYLGNLIKPFRVRFITKLYALSYNTYYRIYIELENYDHIDLPNFPINSKMYKGMRPGKHYTPEELGL